MRHAQLVHWQGLVWVSVSTWVDEGMARADFPALVAAANLAMVRRRRHPDPVPQDAGVGQGQPVGAFPVAYPCTYLVEVDGRTRRGHDPRLVRVCVIVAHPRVESVVVGARGGALTPDHLGKRTPDIIASIKKAGEMAMLALVPSEFRETLRKRWDLAVRHNMESPEGADAYETYSVAIMAALDPLLSQAQLISVRPQQIAVMEMVYTTLDDFEAQAWAERLPWDECGGRLNDARFTAMVARMWAEYLSITSKDQGPALFSRLVDCGILDSSATPETPLMDRDLFYALPPGRQAKLREKGRGHALREFHGARAPGPPRRSSYPGQRRDDHGAAPAPGQ